MHSSTSPVCSATWMWIGPAKPSASVDSAAIDAALAARSEWIASPESTSGRARGPIAPRCLERLGGRRAKATLIVAQVGSGEAGALVQHRQDRQADAGIGGGIGERPRHRQRIGVLAAVAVAAQVVELADMGVAAAQQLEVELRRDRAQLLRADAQRDRVHPVAPRPEVVARRVAPLGQADEGALEGVAVRVDDAGEQRPGDDARARGRERDIGA